MTKLINNLSIKNKLVFSILSVTLIAIGIGFTVAIITNVKNFRDDAVYNTVVNAKLIGYYAVPALAFYDVNGAEEILGKLQVVPYIKAAYIFDDKGNLFAKFSKTTNSVIEYPGRKQFSNFSGDNLFVSEPIVYRSQNYGIIVLNTSIESLNEKISTYIINMIAIMFGVMIVAYFIAVKLQSFISRPVLKLCKSMEEVYLGTDYSIRVTKTGHDEIGLLYDGFNNMLSIEVFSN